MLFGLAFITKVSAGENDELSLLTIVTEHLAPFQIVDNDSIGGLSTEIEEATVNAASYQYTLDVHPRSVAFKRATQQKNTCIYSLVRLPIREEQFNGLGILSVVQAPSMH
jgi:polar amino acid transport system substrate-binding protein